MKICRAVLGIVLLALLGSAFFVIPVRAQSGNCDYARVWDFAAGDYAGWTIQHGTQTTNGAEPVYINGTTKLLQMTLMCDEPWGNPRKFLYGFWSSHGWAGIRPYSLALLDENGDVISGWGNLGQGSGAAGQGWWEYSGNFSAVYGIQIYFQWGTSETYWVNYFEINHTTPVGTATPVFTPTPVVVPGTGAGWSYPVAQRDRPLSRPELYRVLPVFEELSEFTDLEPDVPSVVAGFSLSAGANVHAILPGEITAVTRLEGMCLNQGSVANLQSGSCQITDPGDPALFSFLYLLYSEAYLITQDAGEYLLHYVVAAPRVEVGDVIAQDCIIGITIGMTKAAPYPIVGESAAGWTLVAGLENDEPFDLLTPLSHEPVDLVCRAETSPQCSYVRNPNFQGSDFWELGTFGGKTASIAPGGGLIPDGYASQSAIMLDPETEYSIIVRHVPGIPSAPAYSFIVSLGSTDTIITYTPDPSADAIGKQEVIIPPQTFEAGTSSGLYDLTISSLNNSSAAIVDFICIFDPDEDVPPPTGGCLLFNHEFDNGDDYWSSQGVVVIDAGLARVLDEGQIWQSLRLLPKESGPQTYTLSVLARRAGIYAEGETIDLDWEWGIHSGTLTGFTTTLGSNFQEKTTTFTVSGEATEDLALLVDADNSTQKSLHIDRVCVTTEDGTVPPGYLPPTIEANCKICIYEPSGDLAQDLSELVGWLGCMLLSLWECSVKSVLVGMWQTLTAILMMFGYFRMWLSLSFSNFAEFANGNAVVFADYLRSELWNLGTRFENALTSAMSFTAIQGGGGAGLWDFLTALVTQLGTTIGNVISGVIGPLIDLIREIIAGIFGIIFAVINLIAALLSLIVGLITGVLTTLLGTALGIVQAIINAINMTPVAPMPEWLISCGDPLSGTFAPDNQLGYLCLGIWMMEQKFQTGPAQYFLPIFIGLASLALLMWGVQRILGVIANLGAGGNDE